MIDEACPACWLALERRLDALGTQQIGDNRRTEPVAPERFDSPDLP
jgi:hypothetical protein